MANKQKRPLKQSVSLGEATIKVIQKPWRCVRHLCDRYSRLKNEIDRMYSSAQAQGEMRSWVNRLGRGWLKVGSVSPIALFSLSPPMSQEPLVLTVASIDYSR